MEILTGLLVSYAITRNLVTFNVVDDTGKKKSFKFSKGRYSRRDFNAFQNKQIEIEFAWGTEGERKLLSISFPSPTINLNNFGANKIFR
jgi:hypothetical protein